MRCWAHVMSAAARSAATDRGGRGAAPRSAGPVSPVLSFGSVRNGRHDQHRDHEKQPDRDRHHRVAQSPHCPPTRLGGDDCYRHVGLLPRSAPASAEAPRTPSWGESTGRRPIGRLRCHLGRLYSDRPTAIVHLFDIRPDRNVARRLARRPACSRSVYSTTPTELGSPRATPGLTTWASGAAGQVVCARPPRARGLPGADRCVHHTARTPLESRRDRS